MDFWNAANYLTRNNESLKYLENNLLYQYYKVALNLAHNVFVVTTMSNDNILSSDYKHLSFIIQQWIENYHTDERFFIDIEKILKCGKLKILYYTFAEQLYYKVKKKMFI